MSGRRIGRTWISSKPQCIVLCAGAGTRMLPETLHRPKVLLEIAGRPLLEYVIEFWRPHVSEFILVIGDKGEMIRQYADRRGWRCRYVEQGELRGIAHAVSLCDDQIRDRFVLHLGDCLLKGRFAWPDQMDVGVGVWQTAQEADILQSYSVEIEGGTIARVEEKPHCAPNDLCGMGTYFLDRRVLETIDRTPPSALRGEQEITDVLANLIAEGRPLSPVFFDGDYLNVTYPGDLARARHMMKSADRCMFFST